MGTKYHNSFLRDLNESSEESPYNANDYNHETDKVDKFIKQGTIIAIVDYHSPKGRKYNIVSIKRYEAGISSTSGHYYPASYSAVMCEIDVNPFLKIRESQQRYINGMVCVDGEIVHMFKSNNKRVEILGEYKFKSKEQLILF